MAVGDSYAMGYGCEIDNDNDKAIKWYIKAIKQGDIDARNSLKHKFRLAYNNGQLTKITTSQSSGCLLPILATFFVIGIIISL